MDKAEKADFLLEQVRLTAAERDFVRTGIIANKINKKVLDEEGFEAARVRFYDLMAGLAHAKRDAVGLAKTHLAELQTRGAADAPAQWRRSLSSAIVALSLAPFDNEVSDLLHRVKGDKRTRELAAERALLELLTTDEIIPWPLPAPHAEVLAAHDIFSINPNTIAGPASTAAAAARAGSGAAGAADVEMAGSGASAARGAGGVATSSTSLSPTSAAAVAVIGVEATRPALRSAIVLREDEAAGGWGPIFRKRVFQHNLRVLAKYFTRIRIPRMCEILSVDAGTAEAQLAEVVSSGMIYARIDRPAGTVSFVRPAPATEILGDWAGDLDSVLHLVETATHGIQKE
jgi:hypothetical protein